MVTKSRRSPRWTCRTRGSVRLQIADGLIQGFDAGNGQLVDRVDDVSELEGIPEIGRLAGARRDNYVERDAQFAQQLGHSLVESDAENPELGDAILLRIHHIGESH